MFVYIKKESLEDVGEVKVSSEITKCNSSIWLSTIIQNGIIHTKSTVKNYQMQSNREKIWKSWNESSQIFLSPSINTGNIWEREKTVSLYEDINEHKTLFVFCVTMNLTTLFLKHQSPILWLLFIIWWMGISQIWHRATQPLPQAYYVITWC